MLGVARAGAAVAAHVHRAAAADLARGHIRVVGGVGGGTRGRTTLTHQRVRVVDTTSGAGVAGVAIGVVNRTAAAALAQVCQGIVGTTGAALAVVEARTVRAATAGFTQSGGGVIGAARALRRAARAGVAVRCVNVATGAADAGVGAGVPAAPAVHAALRERGRIIGRRGVRRIGAVGAGECFPGDVAGAAQADAAGLGAAAARGIVPAHGSAGLPERVVRAVEEVAVLVDPEPEVAADEPVVGRVEVRAGVAKAATPGAEAVAIAARRTRDGRGIELARVHQIEAHAVGAVTARTSRVATVGDGLEGHRDALARGEGGCRDDAAVLAEATRIGCAGAGRAGGGGAGAPGAVGETQRAVAHGVRQRLGGPRDAVISANEVFVVVKRAAAALANGLTAGHLAGRVAGRLDTDGRTGREAGAIEEVPAVGGAGAGEILAHDRLRLCCEGQRERRGRGEHQEDATVHLLTRTVNDALLQLVHALDDGDRIGRAAVSVGVNLVGLALGIARSAEVRDIEHRAPRVGRVACGQKGIAGYRHADGDVLHADLPATPGHGGAHQGGAGETQQLVELIGADRDGPGVQIGIGRCSLGGAHGVARRDVAEQPPFGILLCTGRSMQSAFLLAHVAGNLFLRREAAEHAEAEDGDDEEQQQRRDERDAALIPRCLAVARADACSASHVCSPARAMTSTTRSKSSVAGCPGWFASGLANVRITRTALT